MRGFLTIDVALRFLFRLSAISLSLLVISCGSIDKRVGGPKADIDHDLSITFGSCSKIDLEQHLWDDILNHKGDVWIWLGDIIYGDTENMSVLRSKYDRQKNHEGYRQLLDSMSVLGVWDDHDYGLNNGGKEYRMKEESREILFDFLDIPSTDIDRRHEGAYNETLITLNGIEVHVILMDVRYFRDPLSYRRGKPLPNLTGTILGEAQWQWLDSLLENSKADMYVIGSGIQVLPQDHKYEKWANFPVERQKLLDRLNLLQKPVVLISGDRHIGEISSIELPNRDLPIWEVTSSSLTHSWESAKEYNRHRIGPLVRNNNFGAIDLTRSGETCHVRLSLFTEGHVTEASDSFDFTLP